MYTIVTNLWNIPFAVFILSSVYVIFLNLLFDIERDKKVKTTLKIMIVVAMVSLLVFVITFYLIDASKGTENAVTITPESVDKVMEDAFTNKVSWEIDGEIYSADSEDCAIVEVDKTRLVVTPTTEAPYHTTKPADIPTNAELPYHETVQTDYCHTIKLFGKEYRSKPFHSTICHRFYVPEGYFETD